MFRNRYVSFNHRQNYLRHPRYILNTLSHDILRSLGNDGKYGYFIDKQAT